MQRFTLSSHRLPDILAALRTARVGVIGDFCLDVYWLADMTRSELSRETPHFPLPIVEERMSLGGAGNLAANVAALRPLAVAPLCIIGEDWRGAAMRGLMESGGLRQEGVLSSPGFITPAYIKPIRRGISPVAYEDPRLDFANDTPISSSLEEALIAQLEKAAQRMDLLCVADQLPFGCITPRVREAILRLAVNGLPVVVDSRDRVRHFRGKNVILKPNHIEAARALGRKPSPETDLDAQAHVLKALAELSGCAVFLTLGPMGCLYGNADEITHIPAETIPPPTDFVGAGDTFLAALSTALAAGIAPEEAAALGNRAAGVTIRKIGVTGVASPEEIVGEG